MNLKNTSALLGKVVQLDTDDSGQSWAVIGQGNREKRFVSTGFYTGHYTYWNEYHLQNLWTGELATVHRKHLVLLAGESAVA